MVDIFGFVDEDAAAVESHRRKGGLPFLPFCLVAKAAAALVLEVARMVRAQHRAAKADDSDIAYEGGSAVEACGRIWISRGSHAIDFVLAGDPSMAEFGPHNISFDSQLQLHTTRSFGYGTSAWNYS